MDRLSTCSGPNHAPVTFTAPECPCCKGDREAAVEREGMAQRIRELEALLRTLDNLAFTVGSARALRVMAQM